MSCRHYYHLFLESAEGTTACCHGAQRRRSAGLLGGPVVGRPGFLLVPFLLRAPARRLSHGAFAPRGAPRQGKRKDGGVESVTPGLRRGATGPSQLILWVPCFRAVAKAWSWWSGAHAFARLGGAPQHTRSMLTDHWWPVTVDPVGAMLSRGCESMAVAFRGACFRPPGRGTRNHTFNVDAPLQADAPAGLDTATAQRPARDARHVPKNCA